MREAVLVSVAERVEHFGGDADRPVDRERALAPDDVSQGFSRYERHHEPKQIIGFAGIEQRRDMRVVQLGSPADLAQEAVGGNGDRQLGVEHLDRHFAAVFVEGTVQRGVSAAPHRGDDVVTVAQGLADPSDQFASHRRHNRRPGGLKRKGGSGEPPHF